MNWKEIVIGYGVEKVPRELVRECHCNWEGCSGARVLYTTEALVPREEKPHVRGAWWTRFLKSTYCRFHMEAMYR